MTEDQLKDILQGLNESGRLPTASEKQRWTQAMLRYLGTTDAVLRDDLIYEQFDRWVEAGLYTGNELEEICAELLDEQHLLCFPEHEDAVFTRSFSLLWLAVILYYHRNQPWLGEGQWLQVVTAIVDYADREEDLRGYVPAKGWAHAPAHWADVVGQLLLCAECSEEDTSKLLDSVAVWLGKAHQVFSFGEDERLARAVLHVQETDSQGQAFLQSWFRSLGFSTIGRDLPQDYVTAMTTKQFLRSAYFQAKRKNGAEDLTLVLVDVLNKVHSARMGGF